MSDLYINIDERNLEFFEAAVSTLGIQYELGSKLKVGDGYNTTQVIRPVFIKNSDDCKKAIKTYIVRSADANRIEGLKWDSLPMYYVHGNMRVEVWS